MTTASAAPPSAAAPPSRLRAESPLRRILSRPESGALVGAIVVFVIFAVLGGKGGFLSPTGFAGYLELAAQVGILGASVTLLMIAGEFDLSIGSVIGACGLFLAMLISVYSVPVVIAIPATFAFALAIGFVNGWLVIRTGLPSFIVTLATQLILRGATIALTRQITNLTIVNLPEAAKSDPAFVPFATTLFKIDTGTFKVELVWWIVVVVLASWVLMRTRFGNWIYAVGGSAQAARYVGVPVNRVKILLFMGTAASAALYACVVVPSVGSANVRDGTNREFEAIITAVVGGTLLTGGYGSALGSAFGAFILGTTQLGINFVGINSDWYQVVLGTILLLAVLVNTYLLRRASGAR